MKISVKKPTLPGWKASSVLPTDTQQKVTNIVQKLYSQNCAVQLGKHPGIAAEQVEGDTCYLLPLKS